MSNQLEGIEHGGKSGYRNGCRCVWCYAAYKESRKSQGKELRKNEADRRHGTLTGYQYGCRCDRCKRAKRKQNEYAAAQMAADPGDKRHGTYTGYTYGCHCDRCKAARDARTLPKKPVMTGPFTDAGVGGALE